MNTDSKILGYFSACFAIVIWGITFVCTKHLLLYFFELTLCFDYVCVIIKYNKLHKINKITLPIF